jgi:hypothetical protein
MRRERARHRIGKLGTILIAESLDNHFHQYLMANWAWTSKPDSLEYISPQSENLKFRLFLKPIFLIKFQKKNIYDYSNSQVYIRLSIGLGQ